MFPAKSVGYALSPTGPRGLLKFSEFSHALLVNEMRGANKTTG